MAKLIWILMALAAGSALPLQGGVNAKRGKAGSSPAHAACRLRLVL
ncbi:DMT family transporter [Stieleria sp. TO1_6]|nr:DMT family transporter [Stieleria tagensis]MCO8123082.1 DMT family transporter [Stieleria tagensis]